MKAIAPGKSSGPPLRKMALLFVGGFAFVAIAHVAIWLILGVVAGDAASTVIQMTGFFIGFLLPTLVYFRWKDESRKRSADSEI
jgi:hypothetical protein